MLVAIDRKERASKLCGVFEKLGERLDVRSFEKRLIVQKRVYMLQLHPEFHPYLGYHYSLFIHGPYSPDLADIYYHIPKDVKPMEIDVSREALEYGREVMRMDRATLEIASTIIEVIRVNRGISDERIVEHVHMLKPSYKSAEIWDILLMVKNLKRKYNLVF